MDIKHILSIETKYAIRHVERTISSNCCRLGAECFQTKTRDLFDAPSQGMLPLDTYISESKAQEKDNHWYEACGRKNGLINHTILPSRMKVLRLFMRKTVQYRLARCY